uniref:Photosystem I reaction center subunit XII n=1 Tax=Floydiella terrestris TaxID=51328 RepID=E2DSK5_FLOTE|nr:M polypeptide of photosystem I [Floydiella terrestris]YP_010500074.1 M polypeptide of photosystem I [Gormaniella terricola]ACZ58444.1 M polypeptide of photosystem I [Floydiella terrestris]UWV18251.1 M polypeptide of photosystem I [Gormaniella terricola]
MTIIESQVFIAMFIALGVGFLAFLLGTALYQRN